MQENIEVSQKQSSAKLISSMIGASGLEAVMARRRSMAVAQRTPLSSEKAEWALMSGSNSDLLGINGLRLACQNGDNVNSTNLSEGKRLDVSCGPQNDVSCRTQNDNPGYITGFYGAVADEKLTALVIICKFDENEGESEHTVIDARLPDPKEKWVSYDYLWSAKCRYGL